MRAGWDAARLNAPELARIAAAEGVELVTIHGRTREQQYTGRADRGVIRRVVEAVPGVPVLANGDVVRPEDAFSLLRETGATGVMIGRGAIGNPWLFARILALARGGEAREPSAGERMATVERHVGLLERSCPDRTTLGATLKKYVSAYAKGLPGAAAFRQAALSSDDADAILAATRAYFSGLARAA
jgi:tRNA-dihydrouridine synthase